MKTLSKISFKKKLVAAFLVLVIGNVFICAYYVMHLREVVNINQEIQDSYSAVWEISMAVHAANEQITLYMSSGDEETRIAYESYRDTALDSIEILEYSTDSIEEIFIVRAIKNSMTVQFRTYDQAVISLQNESPYFYTGFYDGMRISEYSYMYFDEYIDLLLEENNAKIEAVKKETDMAFFSVQVLLIIFGVVYIIFASIFSQWITKPIINLVKAARKISNGDYEFADLPVMNEGELGELTTTFNVMKADISQAIEVLEDRVEMEKHLREVELKEMKNAELLKEAQYLALQSQMNPHFLFNTLNAISRSIQLLPPEISVKLVHSLATICRYNLDHVSTYSTIEEELYVAGQYIYIQQHRFEERIQYIVECADACKEMLVPSLLLQPLVENALIHGIENREEGGKIYVKIEPRDKGLRLRVFDDGVGISSEKLRMLQEGSQKGAIGHTTGIGLGNILQRIKLIEYGKMKIVSREQKGTLITIYLPCQ